MMKVLKIVLLAGLFCPVFGYSIDGAVIRKATVAGQVVDFSVEELAVHGFYQFQYCTDLAGGGWQDGETFTSVEQAMEFQVDADLSVCFWRVVKLADPAPEPPQS